MPKETTPKCDKINNKPEKDASPDDVLREKKLLPLRVAAERIAELICNLSGDSELFVSDADCPASRKVDTKTLKEFSAVIKEMSAVICELNGLSPDAGERVSEGIRIEFEAAAFDSAG